MSNQIMQFVQDNELFSQMSAEEAATLSGGGPAAGAYAGIYAVGGGLFGSAVAQAGILAASLNPTIG
ncbi:hypothetical protein [Nostoc sp. UIC 10630]|uniref:hypothetical protein n=1 Tax=Nostoc sp. UIC 10630 TaxID=2100146 RepID=UPI0013D4815F|nr:hypothetical protein [Nostoc sp. UIC 10630]NEU84555.1 hypothetical protein [Nostoc sp. UIC 10630]